MALLTKAMLQMYLTQIIATSAVALVCSLLIGEFNVVIWLAMLLIWSMGYWWSYVMVRMIARRID